MNVYHVESGGTNFPISEVFAAPMKYRLKEIGPFLRVRMKGRGMMKENGVKPEDLLNDKAKLAIRDYMFKLVTFPGIVLTIAGFLLGFLVNEIAREKALQEAYKEAYEETMEQISDTIIDVTKETTEALKNTENQGKNLQIVLDETEKLRGETELNLVKTNDLLAEVMAASTGIRNQEKEFDVAVKKAQNIGEQLELQLGLLVDSKVLDPNTLANKVADSLASRDDFKSTLFEEEVKKVEQRFGIQVEAVEKVQIEIRQDLEEKILELNRAVTAADQAVTAVDQKIQSKISMKRIDVSGPYLYGNWLDLTREMRAQCEKEGYLVGISDGHESRSNGIFNHGTYCLK